MDDDAEARALRAARLREQIKRITGEGPEATRPGEERAEPGEPGQRRSAPRVHPVSPRAFVERRMRELDGDKDNKKS